jgi:hypothetical protein
MAITEINPVIKKGSGGGGLLGSVLGGLAGITLGAATGGALAAPGAVLGGALSGALAGGSVGQTVGGISGNLIDKPKADEATPMIQNNPVDRAKMNAMGSAPEVQMASMQNAKNLLSTSDLPDAKNYMDQIDQAQSALKQRLGNNSSLR